MKEAGAAALAPGPPHVDPVRDGRAKLLNVYGAVRRAGDRFSVTPPSLLARPPSFSVWRDQSGVVRCSCRDYQDRGSPVFRCEHILAVKHFLLAKPAPPYRKPEGLNTESVPAEVMPSSAADYRKNQRSIGVPLVRAASIAAHMLGHGASPHGTFRQGMPEALLHSLEACGDLEAARLACETFLERHQNALAST